MLVVFRILRLHIVEEELALLPRLLGLLEAGFNGGSRIITEGHLNVFEETFQVG